MALKLKLRDSSGNCCCNTPCTILCSTRGGLAALCGHSEFTAASNPPKKYRKLTLSGSRTIKFYTDSGCSVLTNTTVLTYSGTNVYNAVTCAVTNTGNVEQVSNTGTINSAATASVGAGDCEVTPVLTRKQRHHTTTGACCTATGGWEQTTFPGTPNTDTLTDEDTETDAINRVLSANPWTDYAPCSSTFCCRTTRQVRGAGQFSLEYVEARFKVSGTGTPGATLPISVDVYRRPYGVGDYVLFSTMHTEATVDGDGTFLTDVGVIVNDPGYETVVSNCRVDP